MNNEQPLLFALESSKTFGAEVARRLGLKLSGHEEIAFDDGEVKPRPLVNVRGKDVFVIQSLYADSKSSVHDKLCLLLFFIGALRDASAERITAVLPYFAYARHDREVDSRDPVTNKYMALMLEGVGVDRVLTMDVHNLAALQNAFRCPADHLEAGRTFSEHLADRLAGKAVTVVSPDAGGLKRARRFRKILETRLGAACDMAFIDKDRSGKTVIAENVIGDVQGRTAIIIDDMISTGSTLTLAAKICRKAGAESVIAAATHGLFVGGANEHFACADVSEIIVTDTVSAFRVKSPEVKAKLTVLPVTGVFAEAIKRIHAGESVRNLLEG